MFTPLTGRTALITGATKGIGRGLARVFLEAGAHVAVVGRDEAAGAATVDELRRAGGEALQVVADVSVAADVERMVAETVRRFGGIDVLCANAGIFPSARLPEMTESDIDEIFAVNVKGTMLAVRACLTPLAASGRGRVIVTSSITGPITGVGGWSHYGATKAAQLGFVRGAAVELAGQGITVNAVLPGNIDTEDWDQAPPERRQAMEASIPQGRLGTVADIAHAALFLASEEAGYITGQTIIVDGGQVLVESSA